MTRTDGFSLVEMMIVVAVLSFLSLGATLATGMRGVTAGSDVRVLLLTYEGLRDDAILGQSPRALEIRAATLSRASLSADGEWRAQGDPIALSGTLLSKPGYGAETTTDGALRVVLLPDGRSSAFEVQSTQGRVSRRCEADGWGALTCE